MGLRECSKVDIQVCSHWALSEQELGESVRTFTFSFSCDTGNPQVQMLVFAGSEFLCACVPPIQGVGCFGGLSDKEGSLRDLLKSVQGLYYIYIYIFFV